MTFCPQCEILLASDTAVCPVCKSLVPSPPTPAKSWTASLPASPFVAPLTFAGDILVAGGNPESTAILEWRAPEDGLARRQCTFSHALVKHGTVDLALNQARSLLISQKQQDVALPVLVMRLMDGRLF